MSEKNQRSDLTSPGSRARDFQRDPTPAEHEIAIRALRSGNRPAAAFGAAGVDAPTWRRWLNRGAGEIRRQRDGLAPTPSEQACLALAEDANQAAASGEVMLLDRVLADGRGDWRAAMAVLERRHPEAWAARIQVEIDRELTRALEAIKETVDDATFERIVERLARLADRGSRVEDLEREPIDTTGEVASTLSR